MLFTTFTHANTVNMAHIISYLLSDTVTTTPQEIAIDKVKAYADYQTNPVPIVQDYIDAGATGVTEVNINAVNNAIVSLTASALDTVEEIQGIVDTITAVPTSTTQWDSSNWDALQWQ